MTSCFLCLLCWLYIWRYPHAASPLQLAIFNAENSVLISAEQGHAKGGKLFSPMSLPASVLTRNCCVIFFGSCSDILQCAAVMVQTANVLVQLLMSSHAYVHDSLRAVMIGALVQTHPNCLVWVSQSRRN